MAEEKLRDIRMAIKFRGNSKDDISSGPTAEQKEKYNSRVFSLNSYNWTSVSDDKRPVDSSDRLILTEFQPERTYDFGKILSSVDSLKTLSEFLNGGGVVSTVVQTAAQVLQDKLIDRYSKNPEELTNPTNLSMQLVKNMMKGQYLNTYEIPYNEPNYFNSDGDQGWSASGSEQMIGSEISNLVQQNANINFPMPAQWNNSGGNGLDIGQTEFYLINETVSDFQRNFKFLMAFSAGSFWVQGGIMQFSPNLYDVECPGRFHRNWVAMGLTVTYEGKLRPFTDSSNFLASFKGMNGPTVKIPEAYKVHCKFTDLTPNTYNCWASYILNGKDGGKIGSTTTGTNQAMINEVKDFAGNVVNKGKEILNTLNTNNLRNTNNIMNTVTRGG